VTGDGHGLDVGPVGELLSTEVCGFAQPLTTCTSRRWTREGVLSTKLDPTSDSRDDPRSRPWFDAAMTRGTGAWGEPFVQRADGPLLNRFRMTYATPTGHAGVSEVSVSLDDLLSDVRAMQPSPACLTILVDDRRHPILLPPLSEFRGLEATPVGRAVGPDFLPLADQVLVAGARGETATIGEDTYYVVTQRFDREPGIAWQITIAVPSRELLGGPRRIALILALLAALAFVVVAWRALALASRFSNPLRALAASSARVARGDSFAPPATEIAEVNDLTERFREASTAIRERTRLEAELRHAQRVATIGTLAGGVAHDVNNQLTAILGVVELATVLTAKGAPIDAQLELARSAALDCAELMRSLLSFSRSGSTTQWADVDVNDVLRRAMLLVGGTLGGARVEVALDLAPSLPTVVGDRVLLEQVAINLAVNARDAMPDGGRLTLTSGVGDAGTIFFSVSDTGVGIAPDAREQIFEAFFTTKPEEKGTGLGLAISRGIVNAHHGRIEVESTLGKGSTFTVTLSTLPVRTRGSSRAMVAAPPVEG
jgi:signal transduction histidine kinase